MSQIDKESNELSQGQDEQNVETKFVPVAESIRYHRRAQIAEKEAESLADALAEATAEKAKMSEQLNGVQTEQKLTEKLAAAGVIDLEAAILIAKARMAKEKEADMDNIIERLRNEKQYLFEKTRGSVSPRKTSSAKDRISGSQTALERAAKRAATTGNRADLQEYLKLRRSYL